MCVWPLYYTTSAIGDNGIQLSSTFLKVVGKQCFQLGILRFLSRRRYSDDAYLFRKVSLYPDANESETLVESTFREPVFYFIYKKQMNQEKRETKSHVTSDFGETCK